MGQQTHCHVMTSLHFKDLSHEQTRKAQPYRQPAAVSGILNPGLDEGRLDSLVQAFFVKGLAQSTHRVYSSGQRRYLGFCASANLSAVPASEDTLCKFAAKMASEGLRHRTIKSYMAGIRHLHIEKGLVDPFLPALSRLHYVLRGVKRSQGKEGFSSRERLPITPPLLHQIKGVWERLFKSQKITVTGYYGIESSLLDGFSKFGTAKRPHVGCQVPLVA